jgi:hypothetical protein
MALDTVSLTWMTAMNCWIYTNTVQDRLIKIIVQRSRWVCLGQTTCINIGWNRTDRLAGWSRCHQHHAFRSRNENNTAAYLTVRERVKSPPASIPRPVKGQAQLQCPNRSFQACTNLHLAVMKTAADALSSFEENSYRRIIHNQWMSIFGGKSNAILDHYVTLWDSMRLDQLQSSCKCFKEGLWPRTNHISKQHFYPKKIIIKALRDRTRESITLQQRILLAHIYWTNLHTRLMSLSCTFNQKNSLKIVS